MKTIVVAFLFVTCVGCVGTDVINDVALPGGAQIVLNAQDNMSLQLGGTLTIDATYRDTFGVVRDVALTWDSSDETVATVGNGLITAVGNGNAEITVAFEDTFAGIRLTVVDDEFDVASVVIAAPTTVNLMPAQTIQLTASARNIVNTVLDGKVFEWFTENASIVTVSSQGLVTAVGDGIAEVHAKTDGVKSNSILFMVGEPAARMGTFQSAGGYSSSGTVTAQIVNSVLQIKLSSDFQASIAAGTYIYLANSTSGGTVKSSGLELGQYTTSGTKTFTTSAATLDQYKYVVVLCKPFGITFGFAELKP
jgi:Bacterial Ig-like domain (group 2)